MSLAINATGGHFMRMQIYGASLISIFLWSELRQRSTENKPRGGCTLTSWFHLGYTLESHKLRRLLTNKKPILFDNARLPASFRLMSCCQYDIVQDHVSPPGNTAIGHDGSLDSRNRRDRLDPPCDITSCLDWTLLREYLMFFF